MSKYNSSLNQNSGIGNLVRRAEDDFITGETTVSKYVQFSLHEDINKIYAYLDSTHISGPTDSQGREKPFFNIVLAARNIWFRATDMDRKNAKIRSTKSKDDIGVFLASIHLQEWMRRENFGQFLNNWGINSAAFNESVVKFVEQDGRLIPGVVPWNRIICDQVDFANNPKIEVIEMTEAQLYQQKGYDQKMVKSLCEAVSTRETIDGQNKDNKSEYIKLYEVHGNLPKSFLTGKEEDEDEYVQQMHVLSFVEKKESKGDYDDFCLYSGRESKDPYLLTALLPEIDGSISLKGSVKTLFDAQWMQNHSMKAIKDQLDLASKMIFQTSDKTFVGQNALSAIENGDILIHAVNEPITLVNNDKSPDINALQGFRTSWKQLGNEIVGVSESMLGQTPPSGTAWRQVNALLQESHSLFEIMSENKALALEEMLREFIIPFLKTKMDNADEIAATLEANDIEKIDARYIKNKATQDANQKVRGMILEGKMVSPEDQKNITAYFADTLKNNLKTQGNRRFFLPSEISDKTWKELFKDIEWEVEVDASNENVDQDMMQTLTTVFQIVADPVRSQVLNTPRGKFLFNKILQRTGAVSTIELANLEDGPQSPMQPQNPNNPAAPVVPPVIPGGAGVAA